MGGLLLLAVGSIAAGGVQEYLEKVSERKMAIEAREARARKALERKKAFVRNYEDFMKDYKS